MSFKKKKKKVGEGGDRSGEEKGKEEKKDEIEGKRKEKYIYVLNGFQKSLIFSHKLFIIAYYYQL